MALLVKNELEAARASAADPAPQQEFEVCSTSMGASAPLGATVSRSGANFSLFCRKASRVELLLFDREDAARPTQVINIDPATNRTYHYWHVRERHKARPDLWLQDRRTSGSRKWFAL